MPPTVTTGRAVGELDEIADEKFELDMRVMEATTPIVVMMCNTNDPF